MAATALAGVAVAAVALVGKQLFVGSRPDRGPIPAEEPLMRIVVVALFILSVATLVSPAKTAAQPGGPGGYRGMPYGQFCPGMQWGPYGARKPVRTPDEAKVVIETYFTNLGREVQAGKIEEHTFYFQVEILDRSGTLIDTAIVDKRSGRIRSIY